MALLHPRIGCPVGEAVGMSRRCVVSPSFDRSAFVGFRFPPEVILLAVRWYLRYGLSYRDVEELLAERGIEVDHVTIYRWVQRFTPLLIEAARPCRHSVGTAPARVNTHFAPSRLSEQSATEQSANECTTDVSHPKVRLSSEQRWGGAQHTARSK